MLINEMSKKPATKLFFLILTFPFLLCFYPPSLSLSFLLSFTHQNIKKLQVILLTLLIFTNKIYYCTSKLFNSFFHFTQYCTRRSENFSVEFVNHCKYMWKSKRIAQKVIIICSGKGGFGNRIELPHWINIST